MEHTSQCIAQLASESKVKLAGCLSNLEWLMFVEHTLRNTPAQADQTINAISQVKQRINEVSDKCCEDSPSQEISPTTIARNIQLYAEVVGGTIKVLEGALGCTDSNGVLIRLVDCYREVVMTAGTVEVDRERLKLAAIRDEERSRLSDFFEATDHNPNRGQQGLEALSQPPDSDGPPIVF